MLTWPLRVAVRVVLAPLALAVLGASLVGFFGGSLWLFDLVASFRPQFLAVAFLLALPLILAKGMVGGAAATVAVLINVVVIVPVAFGELPRIRDGGERLRVGHLNLQDRNGDPDAFIEWIQDEKPDIFVVLEASNWNDALEPGVPGYDITRSPDEPFADVLVLSRIPVTVVEPATEGLPSTSVVVRTQLDGRRVRILALHSTRPTSPGSYTARRRHLASTAEWARGSAVPAIIVGDLNATPWNEVFRELLDDADLRNSLVGNGIQASWPTSFELGAIPIDHALMTKQLTTSERSTGPGFGSLHRSLIVEIGFVT